MEGGLALMCFRMLLWVCSLALVFSRDINNKTLEQILILPQHTNQPREGDRVTLRCELLSLPPKHVEWTKRDNITDNNTVIVIENNPTELAVKHLIVKVDKRGLYSHEIILYPLEQADEGFYQCKFDTITFDEVQLIVYPRDKFPVCFPDGPAEVTIGSNLLCQALPNTGAAAVSDRGMPNATNDGWVASPTHAGGSPGQELNKTVTNSEHGKTFQCSSTSNDVSAMALACTIGPLKVVSVSTSSHKPLTTPTTVQPSPEYITVLIVSIVIILLTVILLFLCCHYDPRCCQQLRGMLGLSSKPTQGMDRSGNGPEGGYEIPSARPRITSSPPQTTRHVYQTRIVEPTSSS